MIPGNSSKRSICGKLVNVISVGSVPKNWFVSFVHDPLLERLLVAVCYCLEMIPVKEDKMSYQNTARILIR